MKKTILFMAAMCLAAVVSCEQDDPTNGIDDGGTTGDDTTGVGTSVVMSLPDTCTVPVEGGTLEIPYEFNNRPDNGEFFIVLSGADWISSEWVDNAENSTLEFEVSENTGRERFYDMVVRYDYNEGFCLDTVVVHQAGRNADVYIDAKVLTGEYYASDPDQIGLINYYYIWASTLGLWVTGSEGVNVVLYPPADHTPEIEPFDFEGTTYFHVTNLPEGTYPGTTENAVPGTIYINDLYTFYGVEAGNYQYNPRVGITDGSVTIRRIDDTHLEYNATVTCEDGLVYQVSFTGELEDFMFMR